MRRLLRLRDMSRQVTRVDKVKEGTVLSRVQVQVVTGPEVEEGVLATSCMGVLQGRVADGHIVFHAAQTTYRATQSSSHAHDYCTTILYSTCDHLEATIYTVSSGRLVTTMSPHHSQFVLPTLHGHRAGS